MVTPDKLIWKILTILFILGYLSECGGDSHLIALCLVILCVIS